MENKAQYVQVSIDEKGATWMCNKCALTWKFNNHHLPEDNLMNYCPKCGVRIIEEREFSGQITTIHPKPVRLSLLLSHQGMQKTDKVSYQYYGYGILSAEGTCTVGDLPREVLTAKCFKSIKNHGNELMSVYLVDGAL